MKVLIAHGGEAARTGLARALEAAGHELVTAPDGAEALEWLIRDDGPQVALVDWDLPGLDGVEFCRLARQYGSTPPLYVILLTPAELGRDVRSAFDAGANDCLQTPLSGADLRAHVELGCRFAALPLWGAAAAPSAYVHAPLQGVYDREGVFRRLDEELSRARRLGAELSVGLLAIDGLDELAGVAGEGAEDEVLAELVRRMRATLRPYDTIGRVSRDAFLVVVPGTDEENVDAVLGRLHNAVEAQLFTAAEGPPAVRVRLGGATGLDERAESLVVRAQEALDEARAEGRRRVVAGRRAELAAVIFEEHESF
jgi:diguanylate cyclase (GGDEF)-like protein